MAFRQKNEDGRTVEYMEPADLMRGLLERESTAQYVSPDLANLLDKPAKIKPEEKTNHCTYCHWERLGNCGEHCF